MVSAPGKVRLVRVAQIALPREAGGSIQGWLNTKPRKGSQGASGFGLHLQEDRGQPCLLPWSLDSSQVGTARHPRCKGVAEAHVPW